MTILAAVREARDELVKRAVTADDWLLIERTDVAIKRLEDLLADARKPTVSPATDWSPYT